jgi:hypothetical protein
MSWCVLWAGKYGNLLRPQLFRRLRLMTACPSHVLCKMCNIACSISVSCKIGSPLRGKSYQHVIIVVKQLKFIRNQCDFSSFLSTHFAVLGTVNSVFN